MAIVKYAYTCSKNSTGNKFLAFTEVANITSITVTSGEVSAVTMSGVTLFQQIGFELDTLERKEISAVAKNQVAYEKTIDVTIAKPSKTNNTLIDALADAIACGVVAIVGDNNGVYWLVGWTATDGDQRPLNMMGTNLESGKAMGEADKNVDKITISGKSAFKSLPFDSTLTTALNAGTSTYVNWN